MGHLDQDREYVYDAMNRLVTARLTDTLDWSAAAQRTCIYQYDDLSNRVSHKQGAASIQPYFHDKANRLTTWARPRHSRVRLGCEHELTAACRAGLARPIVTGGI